MGLLASRVLTEATGSDQLVPFATERGLMSAAVALGAADVPGWSPAEERLAARCASSPDAADLRRLRDAILTGRDPLGDAFCALRSPARRRPRGATYTPASIVHAMLEWARGAVEPARVIDPGAGSGRFLVAAARAFSGARLVGVEIDPLAAALARASLAVHGLAGRAEIRVDDYRRTRLDAIAGPTLFIGNPPYVRHHGIAPAWKRWLSREARAHGLAASGLAGLHVHFFLATLGHARRGDAGAFITAAEWLDVNYGQLVRDLLAGPLGLERIDLIEPEQRAFADALTTAAIVAFRVGARPRSIRFRRVVSLDDLRRPGPTRTVPRHRLSSPRWSQLSRPARSSPRDLVELGELCAVHRGQVTGSNRVWIADADTPALPPRLLHPAITRARELFDAGSSLAAATDLRRVVDLPSSLESLEPAERRQVDTFIRWARRRRAHESYVAAHRAPWWSVRLRAPAPILATYMARRPPAFVRNAAGARHINIAHGIYPREAMTDACLDALADHLRATASLRDGRAYAGGLIKFEPREMERLLVPTPEVLRQRASEPRSQRAGASSSS